MSAFAQVDAALAAIQGSTAQPGASAELLKRLITLTRSVNAFPNEDTGASVEHLAGFPGWQDASTGVQQFLHTWLSAAVGSTQADSVQQQLQREPGNWDAWEGVTDVLDVLLEQADAQLSIAAGNDPRAQQAAMAPTNLTQRMCPTLIGRLMLVMRLPSADLHASSVHVSLAPWSEKSTICK